MLHPHHSDGVLVIMAGWGMILVTGLAFGSAIVAQWAVWKRAGST